MEDPEKIAELLDEHIRNTNPATVLARMRERKGSLALKVKDRGDEGVRVEYGFPVSQIFRTDQMKWIDIEPKCEEVLKWLSTGLKENENVWVEMLGETGGGKGEALFTLSIDYTGEKAEKVRYTLNSITID